MLCTCSAPMAEVHDVSIYPQPVDCSSRQLFHTLHSKVSQMYNVEAATPEAIDGGNEYSGAIEEATISCGKRYGQLTKAICFYVVISFGGHPSRV